MGITWLTMRVSGPGGLPADQMPIPPVRWMEWGVARNFHLWALQTRALERDAALELAMAFTLPAYR